jgi:hypothetical protein
MSQKRQNPALARRAPQAVCFDGQDASEIAPLLLAWQARRLVTRFPITLATARVVAELHFADGRSA